MRPVWKRGLDMNFLAGWFQPFWLSAANAVLLLLLGATAKRAWRVFGCRQKAVVAASFLLVLLWILRADIDSGQLGGMNYHLLGMSLATLMLGAPAAFWLGCVLLLPYLVLTGGAANAGVVGMNALLMLLPPVAVCRLLLFAARRRLPPNLFVYIFVNGFIAAALGILVTGALIVSALEWSQAFAGVPLWESAFKVFILIGWGEAFLTGIFTAIFVALVPDMLATFDDARYLSRRADIWK